MDIMTYLGYLKPRYLTADQKLLYTLYTFFVTIGLCILDLLTGINQVFIESDIEKVTNILFVFLAKVILLIKLFPIQRSQNKILDIIHVNRPEFFPDDDEQKKIFLKAVMFQRRVTILFHLMGIVATLTMCFFPFIDPGMSGKLPFSSWYPFEVEAAPRYQIIYTYQTVCLLFMSLADVATDMLISGLLMVASNQLEILRYQIVNIKTVAVENFDKGTFKDFDEAMMKGLVSCIRHYNCILKFADEVNEIFSGPLFFLFFLGVGATGLTLFQFILTPILTVEFFSIAIYQACVLLEVFLYCFYGNSIMVQSDAITNAIYQCGWEDGSLQFKKDVNRFMIRTQKPYCMYAGNFFLMSLPNFILILKWSWSYFTLLHRIHEKGE
ncbi:odorant receptor 2a-like [Coccinella septempunctata]|uniref:odorant receptor 2a-like n=1 Tax=Coccinella septempunctata TaxID=41139 RepID=UPI001D08EA4A|nr:odorant receptor 2a-like [Coccinella septempunctata]